jgi:hypothetical protein
VQRWHGHEGICHSLPLPFYVNSVQGISEWWHLYLYPNTVFRESLFSVFISYNTHQPLNILRIQKGTQCRKREKWTNAVSRITPPTHPCKPKPCAVRCWNLQIPEHLEEFYLELFRQRGQENLILSALEQVPATEHLQPNNSHVSEYLCASNTSMLKVMSLHQTLT